ncbi:hypothetical protein NEOLEDRAFT_1130794 [Neolentinus lepideus HHB14362 ss-1]|uniref:ZZ-type domain-containing protein n=1 Tax=Neolentinus lepideus HHB14362 ss-1 TaxID=1314782 RepID=A0A165U6F3_9AGAM|nr:hypothetical protein NEOLEDRAFT_1130794 [Neolentinus lepideus HHB14362 ss-1]
MFTVKATYRNQTRKFTFPDHQSFLPTYHQLFHQLYRVFPISQSYYLSKLLFSPSPASPSARILLSKEVHNAEDYERAVQQYQGRSWPGALLRFTVFDETPHKPAVRPNLGGGSSTHGGSVLKSRVSSDIWLTGPEESVTVTPSIMVSPVTQRPSPRSPMEIDGSAMTDSDSLYRSQKYRGADGRSITTPGSTTATYVPSPPQSISSLATPQQPQQHFGGLHDARTRGSPPSSAPASSASSTPRASSPVNPPTLASRMPPEPTHPIPEIQNLFGSFMRDFERIMSSNFGEDWRRRQNPWAPDIPQHQHPLDVFAGIPPPPVFNLANNIETSGIPPPPILGLSPPRPHATYQRPAHRMPGSFVNTEDQQPTIVQPPVAQVGNRALPPPPFGYGTPMRSSMLWNVPPPPPLPTLPGSFEASDYASTRTASPYMPSDPTARAIVVQPPQSPPSPIFIRPPPSPPSPLSSAGVQTPRTAEAEIQTRGAGLDGNGENGEETVIHRDVVCDACDQIVVGVRHKCLDCPDYDLCTPCMNSGSAEAHDPFHEFLDIKEPGRVVVHNVFSGNEESAGIPADTRRASSPSQRTPAPVVARPAEQVRHNARCDLCDSVIIGDRYKCLVCPDFDTCESCFSITREQHPKHGFVKVKEPGDIIHRHDSAAIQVHGARCDVCNQVIVGVRYKCMHPSCPDYDLCSQCEALPIAVHPANHPMLKLKARDDVIPTVTRVGGTVMIDDVERTRLEDMQAALLEKESELEQREKDVNERYQDWEDRQCELARQSDVLYERENEVKEKNAILEGREKIVEEKEEELVRREEYLEHQEEDIVEQTESLEDKVSDLHIRAETLEDQLRDLEARREELDEEARSLQGKRSDLRGLERYLEDRDMKLQDKAAILEYRTVQLQDRERALDERERKLEEQEERREPWIGSPIVSSPPPESPWRRYTQDLISLNLPAVPMHVPNIQVEPPSPSMIATSRTIPVPVAVSSLPTPEEIDAIIRRSESTYPEIGVVDVVDVHHDNLSSAESEDVSMPGTLPTSMRRSENSSSAAPSAISADSSLPRLPSDIGTNDLFSELWPAVASELRHLLRPSTEAVPEATPTPGGDIALAQLSMEVVPEEISMPGGDFTHGFRRPSPPAQVSRSSPTSTVEVARDNEDVQAYSPPLATEPLLSRPAGQLAPSKVLSRLADSLANLLSGQPVSPPSVTREAEQEPTDPFRDEAAPDVRAETPVEAPLSVICITENNIPDGQVFPPGAEFVKSWNVINDGERDWPESTELVFVAGSHLGTGADIPKFQIGRVGAGERVDIWTGELKAPEHPGKYVSYWRLSDGQGNQFGKSLWIDITVAEVDTSSGSESLAASSVIMPINAGTPALVETAMPPLHAPSTSSAVTMSDNGSVASSASLISHPSSPVSVNGSDSEWEDTRDFLTPALAPNVAGEVEYVVLYESSDSDRD